MIEGENIVLKDLDSIGDDHVLRLISHLSHDTPRSHEALAQIHQECLQVFSKYPHNSRPSTSSDENKKKPTIKRAASQQGRLGNQLKPTDIANRMSRDRPKIVHPPTSRPQILIETQISPTKT